MDLISKFENKDKMLDIACKKLLAYGECPLKNFSNIEDWGCPSDEKCPPDYICINCIRLYLKYLADESQK